MRRLLAAAATALLLLPPAGRAAESSSEHPMGPSYVSMRQGGSRRVAFRARWRGASGLADATAVGATLRMTGGPEEGDSGLVALAANRWTRRGRTFTYADPSGDAAGIRTVVVRFGKHGGLVKIAGRGAWPYVIDRPQTRITVTLTIGAARWCAVFTGNGLENGARGVRGHSKVAPAACPCEAPATSTFAAIQSAVFERHGCTQAVCHGSSPGQGHLDLRPEVAYQNLVGVPSDILPSEKRVVPGSKETSLLWRKLAAATTGLADVPGTPMPNGAFAPLSPAELHAVELWIYNGAPQTGVIKNTDTLLAACLPPAQPQKIPPADPPAAGDGIQLYSPPWTIPAQGEGEVCFATYYDFSSQVPAELTFDCPPAWGGPTKRCFGYKRTELTQDPNSHHSILRLYRGAADIGDPAWGTFTCHGGEHAGTACTPTGIGVPAPGGADCGTRSACAGTVVPAVACIGYGPADLSVGAAIGADSLMAPQIVISTVPYYANPYPTDVYNVMPVSGIFVVNSHAFNATDTPTTNEQWLNVYFAQPDERQFLVQDVFDALDIFIADVPPFQTAEYCRTTTMPKGTRLFELYSHTHKRGKLFRAWGPGITPPCDSSTEACAPEAGDPFLVTTNYSDPDTVRWATPLALDGADDASRTFKYCADYDNGAADPSTVKRRSTAPLGPLGMPACHTDELACLAGPHKGEPCNGNDSVCDSSPGLGDGLCDACTLHGGVTTDDEMFVLLGSYYCVPGSDCAAASND